MSWTVSVAHWNILSFPSANNVSSFLNKGVFPGQRILTICKQLVFRGHVRPINISEYVENWAQAYKANPDAYAREVKAAFSDFFSMFDVNINSIIEIDEHMRFLKFHGFTSEIDDMEFIRVAYNSTDSIPLADVINIWLQCETDIRTSRTNDTIDQAIRTVSHEEL